MQNMLHWAVHVTAATAIGEVRYLACIQQLVICWQRSWQHAQQQAQ